METAARSVSSGSVSAPKGLYAYLPIEVITAKRLKPGARILYAFLLHVTGWPKKMVPVWYSTETMAKEIGIGRRSIVRYLENLIKAGMVKRWYGPRGMTTAVLKLDSETVSRIEPSRISGRFGDCAKNAGGVRQFGAGSEPIWRVDTGAPIQKQDTAASSPAGMKFDGEDQAVGERRKKVDECRETAEAQKEKGDQKEYNNRMAAQRRLERLGIEAWGGKKFFWFFVRLCRRQAVHISDDIDNVHCLGEDEATCKNVPERYGRAMNDIIKRLKKHGLSKKDLSEILEKLIIGWKGSVGFASHFVSRKMWRGDDISIYLIRKRFDEVVRLTGFSQRKARQRASKLKIPKGKIEDLAQ